MTSNKGGGKLWSFEMYLSPTSNLSEQMIRSDQFLSSRHHHHRRRRDLPGASKTLELFQELHDGRNQSTRSQCHK